jgi:hypothetical protein
VDLLNILLSLAVVVALVKDLAGGGGAGGFLLHY